MYQRIETDTQSNPLLPGYRFKSYLVAGLTPIDAGRELDFFIDRPKGMRGYILNLTIEGQGEISDGTQTFHCHPGDVLLFPPDKLHYYGRAKESSCWHHRWIYFCPRAYWIDWLEWYSRKQFIGYISLSNSHVFDEFDELFHSIELTQQSGRRLSEELSMNLLERLLLRCMEEDPKNPQKIMDPRIIEACQFITNNMSNTLSVDEIAHHVCLSASRLTHLFREQVGINILRWREDQRVMRAKLLLQTTQDSIGNVGRRVGYDDQLYFSRVFRKHSGISPSEYRSHHSHLSYAGIE